MMLFSNIDIEGHSGCSISVIEQGKDLFLEKRTDDLSYVERLIKQAEKQKRFFTTGYKKIQTPEIFDIKESKKSCSVIMEYIHAQNFVEFFDHAGFEKIDRFTKQIIDFIDWEISQSTMQKVPSLVISEKFADVKEKIERAFPDDKNIEFIIGKSENIFNQIDVVYMPVGQCHGDFTLSNILFNHDRLFVIDFLDSFIESPLMDMIKIKQDTAFGWSYLMYGKEYDQVRHQITIEWIDQNLTTHFSGYEWYTNYYASLQLMNFLRILQYADKPDVIFYLKEQVNHILQHHEF